MIYLIDDKKARQSDDYGWTDDKLLNYSGYITLIYSYEDISDNSLSDEIFSNENTVLFHESFFENVTNSTNEYVIDFRANLDEYAISNTNFLLAIFSGSKSSRIHNGNVIHLPVSVLYQNLEVFIQNTIDGYKDLRYLLFGENPNIEESLLAKLIDANNNIDSLPDYITIKKNLFIRPSKEFIQKPVQNIEDEDIKTIFPNITTDADFDEKIKDWLMEKEYDNIFIPLCFGSTLSDFNGLRFATHIRCTKTINQLKPILIYSFVDVKYILNNEYFDILKTRNVHLIDYSKLAFHKAIEIKDERLTIQDLLFEIKKLRLAPPENYSDNHSIANEWAIYRWSKAIGSIDDEIKNVISKVDSLLYFKYLKTIYPFSEINNFTKSQMKINYSGNPKILYIDDEAEKGWYEIFCSIIYDINGIDFYYLDEEFNSKSQDEIINISIAKIVKEDIDLVILDFRLHECDFNASNVQNITGLRLLKKIKELNAGIQVLVFSATNKVWNFQAIQEAGADVFLLKESPELSSNMNITIESIEHLVSNLSNCLDLKFVKKFYDSFVLLKEELLPRKNCKTSDRPLPKVFVIEYLKWLEFSILNILTSKSKEKYVVSFLMLFSVLENIATRIIDTENPVNSNTNKDVNINGFKFKFRINEKFLKKFEDKNKDKNYSKSNSDYISKKKQIRWDQKIFNTIDFLSTNNNQSFNMNEINILVKKRNDIIHSNLNTGKPIKIDKNDIILLFEIVTKNIDNIK